MAASVEGISDKLYVNLVGAFTAGFLLAYMVLWHDSAGERNYYDLAKYVLLAVGSYFIAALLSQRLQRRRLLSKVPGWIPISVLGSIILVVCTLTAHTLFLMGHSNGLEQRTDTSMLLKIVAEMKGAGLFFLMFSGLYILFTLPIMAFVYYMGVALRKISALLQK